MQKLQYTIAVRYSEAKILIEIETTMLPKTKSAFSHLFFLSTLSKRMVSMLQSFSLSACRKRRTPISAVTLLWISCHQLIP